MIHPQRAPVMTPVDAILPDLITALEGCNTAVLAAPPGAGKTTRVAPALINASWAHGGKIILLSPRRIAARAAAQRMAAEMGEAVGETVGYRVRLDARVSARTRIEVVTEGVFTRLILADPELAGVAAVIFDEYHERSLESDLGLALARDAQGSLRDDLRVLVMSATLDVARVSALLDNAPIIESRGRMFAVETHYRPRDARAPLEREAAAAVRFALGAHEGDALVFLPGAREIERTARALSENTLGGNVDVRPLYGAMSPADQDAAIAPSPRGRRKVVLATSIAETSLTIEGVRIVIDSGLSRRPRYEPQIGLARLETVRASQASIEQRRGRAGRVAAGACWRLWSEGETRALSAYDKPEILDADLSSLALDLASWGVRDPARLAWLDAPPAPAWREACALLVRLSAIDADGRITEHGRALARLPLAPRLAHMVVASARECEGRLAARVALLLTEQGLGGREVDLSSRLIGFANARGQRDLAARKLADRIARAAGDTTDDVQEGRAGRALARAFPDRIAKARGAGGAFVMANGRAAQLDGAEALARAPFIVIGDIAGAADRAQILSAAAISREEIEDLCAADIRTIETLSFDRDAGALRGRRARMLGKIALVEGPIEALSGESLARALLETVRTEGLGVLAWSEEARALRARVRFMRDLEAEPWPDWSDEALMESLEEWLAPAIGASTRIEAIDVARALLALLDHAQKRRLDQSAPARLASPAGGSALIDYGAEGGPAAEVRLQEMFGLSVHPTIAEGRAPVVLRLLSPAGRPVQTTRDLPGFWRGSYADVRAQMRGRYPKHPWPEDPMSAAPTRRTKPRP